MTRPILGEGIYAAGTRLVKFGIKQIQFGIVMTSETVKSVRAPHGINIMKDIIVDGIIIIV
jgi:hypothetical protein